MKVYNNDVYLINYFPGSSGTFLQSLMTLMYYKKPIFLHFVKSSNAVNTIKPLYFNESFDDENKIDNQPIYKNVLNIKPFIKHIPIFTRSHQVPDIQKFRYKFPKYKHIIIQLDYIGKILSYGMDYYKNFYDMFRMGEKYGNINKWRQISQVHFNNAKTPYDVSDIQVRHYIEKISKDSVSPYPYDITQNVEELGAISYSLVNIHYNKNETLKLISDLIGKPIDDQSIVFYDTYLKNQEKIYKKLGL